LLLKKKKYAGLKVLDPATGACEREYKGLDIVRRDWCGVAKTMGEKVLDQILAGQATEDSVNWIHNYLIEQGKDMDEGKVNPEQYIITKALTKAPQDYPDAKNQPHVQVALRMQARGKAVRSGQEMEYIICESTATDGPKESFAMRARHLTELSLDPSLKIDVKWYKTQQVHPLVSRLLGPVEGTDAARIAECLGLDGSRFAQRDAAQGGGGDYGGDYAGSVSQDVEALMDQKSRFKSYSSSLSGVKCRHCEKEVSWKQMLQPEIGEATGTNALFRCGSCNGELSPIQAQNLLVMQIRALLKSHSEGWVQCGEETGTAKSRRSHSGRNLTSAHQVLQEISYLEHLFDSATKGYTGTDSRGCRRAASGLKQKMEWLLSADGVNWVQTTSLFAGC